MNKTIRNGIDVKVAFMSSAKQLAARHGSPQLDTFTDNLSARGEGFTGQAQIPGRRAINKIKALLRPSVRAIYRALTPFLRPFAFRIRAYLVAGLPDIRSQDLSLVLAELSAIKNALREHDVLRQAHSSPNERKVLEALAGLNAIKDELREQQDSHQTAISRLDRIEQYAFASARRFAINCGPGEILIRSEVGYILCGSTDHAVVAVLLEAGELERGTRLLIERFLKPWNVFIDVGANLGLHTIAAARAMKGQGRIIAFEPFEPTQHLLEKSIWMNGFSKMTEVHLAAVSSRSGNDVLFLGATSGHHSLFPLTTPSTLAPPPVEVALVRLDDVVPGGTRVDLIKIDVEGAELDVLESAKAIIASNPSISLIVEFGVSHLKRNGQTTKDWLAAFHGLGLVHRAINEESGQLEEWTNAELEATDSVNLFFAFPQSTAWEKAGMV
jgi:FkbM family methyltransferase